MSFQSIFFYFLSIPILLSFFILLSRTAFPIKDLFLREISTIPAHLLCLSAGMLGHPSWAAITPEIETFTACRHHNYFQLIHCNSEAFLAHRTKLA